MTSTKDAIFPDDSIYGIVRDVIMSKLDIEVRDAEQLAVEIVDKLFPILKRGSK